MRNDSSGEETVMIVEDDPPLADLYMDTLSRHYSVLVAHNGQIGIEKMNEEVDVVLLDRHMPKLSGDETAEYIRPRYPDCMVAFVSGVDPGDEILDLDIDMYLQKPVKLDQLQNAVETLLRRKELDHEQRKLRALAEKGDIIGKEKVQSVLPPDLSFEKFEQALSDVCGHC